MKNQPHLKLSGPPLFRDGKTRVDYIFVQEREKPEAQRLQNFRYIGNLRRHGVLVEISPGIKYTSMIFIKLHAPDDLVKNIAAIHGIPLTFEHDRTIPTFNNSYAFFKTKVMMKPNRQDPFFQRCSETVRGEPNKTITSAERIMLLHYMLARTKFGNLMHEYGLDTLIASKNFVAAYPMHDGQYEWTDTGPLNDRQVLAQYWASWPMVYKQQPIHLIYKYFGPDIAFHYAWMEFYTKMLVIPAILGILVFCWGIIERDWLSVRVDRVKEICESSQTVCPGCVHPHCGYKQLKSFCSDARMAYVLDNAYTVMFAVFLTIWATIFVGQWERQESLYLFKWGLLAHTPEADELPNYKRRVKNFVRVNKLTGQEEYYVPSFLKYRRIVISVLVCLLCVGFLISTSVFVLILGYFGKHYIIYSNNAFALQHMARILRNTSSLISIIFLRFYAPYIARIARRLTRKEYHRTHDQYMNAYILKTYFMSFFNWCTMIFYSAFLKSLFYTNPGDIELQNRFFGITSDICPPTIGCTVGLSLGLYYTMCKNYILMIFMKSRLTIFIYNSIKKMVCFWRNKRQKAIQREDLLLPQWEMDYGLMPEDKTFFVENFISIIMEYGIMTFFIAATPLLPFIAMVNNIGELRVTAINLLKYTKRNVPKRMLGIGAWKVALSLVTRMSFLISGCVIAFSSKFVHRAVYYLDHGSLKGFVNETITEFAISDFASAKVRDNLKQKFPNVTTCYFSGMKNNYNHTYKYFRSDRFWQVFSVQLVALVIFVHLVYFINGLLTFSVSPVPAIIKETQAYDERRLRTKGLNVLT